MRKLYVLAFLWLALGGLSLVTTAARPVVLRHSFVQPSAYSGSGGAWFQAARPYCNPVEVDVRIRFSPPPEGLQGAGFAAACLALAGRIDRARDVILELDPEERWRAAGIVFNVGHPVADAGDDLAAGPIMELVVEFWPNHYMALYHAGAARWSLGDGEGARPFLEDFLEYYEPEDGWTASARSMLEQIAAS